MIHTFRVGTEIERKWVAAGLPAAIGPGLQGTRMRQGYLAEDGDVAVRVRITDQSSQLTVKAGGGEVRTEVEVDLELSDGEQLWPHTEGRRLVKTRYRVPLPDSSLVAEVDLYEGELTGLCTVEVEFESVEASTAFAPPPWFGREVTGVAGWSNAELARRGRPPAP